jgi:GNAT superfamily N-acetyltransferase/uncharacterized protein YjiS (DUF1127 family)
MIMYQTQHRSAAALFLAAAAMQAAARHVHGAAKGLHAWLEKRRVAAAALDDFAMMSERDLLDIGLTRVDVRQWPGVRPIDARYEHPLDGANAAQPFRHARRMRPVAAYRFIGATVLAAGLLQLIEGGPRWMWASALAVSGRAGVRRLAPGWTSLEPAGSVPAVPDVSGDRPRAHVPPTRRVARDLRHFPQSTVGKIMPLTIQRLSEGNRLMLVVHFLALSMRDRYLRFGSPFGATAIASYVDRIDFDHDAVFGAHDDQLALVGAAHIAFEQDLAEIALSVLPAHRRRGVASALFTRAVAHRNRPYRGCSCIFSREIRRLCV